MSLLDSMVRVGLPLLPRRVLWLVARRYVAGSGLPDALSAVSALKAQGYGTIIDLLGEHVDDVTRAREAAAEYHRALEQLSGADPESYISVKPTHIGLSLDKGLCRRLLSGLCTAAAERGHRVRFEMEDSTTVDATLEVFEQLRGEHPNLGCVLQSRLFRTESDVDRLLAGSGPPLNVRLVKGIYVEPAEIAWTEDREISASFLRIATKLLESGAFVGLATHDDRLGGQLLGVIREHGLDAGTAAARRYEFQCLMGVRRDVAQAWLDDGHPVRIYVPYGEDWHAYSMRRLTRNPEIARHVLRAMLRRRR
jgi:proline dehydrogenase